MGHVATHHILGKIYIPHIFQQNNVVNSIKGILQLPQNYSHQKTRFKRISNLPLNILYVTSHFIIPDELCNSNLSRFVIKLLYRTL